MSEPCCGQTTGAVLIGASGRMGLAILAAAPACPALKIVAAIASAQSTALGRDSGTLAGVAPNHVPVTGALDAVLPQAQVVIDFSSAQATRANLAACVRAGKPLLIGTTGFEATLQADFDAAAQRIALLIAPNTSLGVTLLMELARQAAGALPGFALSVSETHHAGKRDAPSGTALALVRALRAGRGPQGEAQRGAGAFAARRERWSGEHTVSLTGPGEVVFLGHRALERSVFAQGALAAALWLAPRPPGRYAMRDLLDVKTVT